MCRNEQKVQQAQFFKMCCSTICFGCPQMHLHLLDVWGAIKAEFQVKIKNLPLLCM